MNHLGAGFGISVKDLELRGAGNVLGAQQSGHIAAVGYDMYCRLLKLTIERLQAGESFDKDAVRREEQDAGVELELGIAAYLPDTWVALEETRLELLRQMVMIDSIEDAERTEQMLRDRFGRVPEEASNLVRLFRLKALLDPHGLTRLAWRGTSYLVEYEDPVALERFFQEMGGAELDLRRVRRGVAHLMIPPSMEAAEEALDWFEGLLKAQLSANRMAAAGGT
jgi:transcription-repair coupling factor (superfamily II helicase)